MSPSLSWIKCCAFIFYSCKKGWNHALELSKRKDNQWALFAKAFLDRTRLALSSKAEYFHQILQPSAEYLGSLLGVDQWAVSIWLQAKFGN